MHHPRGTRQALSHAHCAGERHREGVLQGIAVNLEDWTVQVKREKAIYHTLNKLSVDTSRKVSARVDTSLHVHSLGLQVGQGWGGVTPALLHD